MCDPATLGIIGTVVSAGGSIMQGSAQQAAANANANAANENAKLARLQANQVEEQKARELTQLHREASQTKAAQRVAGAGMGVDMSYGTGLNQLQTTAVLAKEDEDTLQYNAALKKWGYDSNAVEYENQASQYKAQGQNAMTMGLISGVTTLAMGASNLMGNKAPVGNTGSGTINAGFDRMGSFNGVATKWNQWKNPATYVKTGWL